MRTIMLVILGLFISFQNSFAAGDGWRKNSHVLPQYCKDRAAGNDQRWRSALGSVYIHAHHYCSGIYAEHKARGTSNKRQRDPLLSLAANQMRYVSKACKVGCTLYPELHSRWGWALGEQGKIAEAIKHYQLAIKAKPTYSTAYAGLSDLYVKIKQPTEARGVLEAGLKARPRSKKLKRRLQKLNNSK